MINATDAAHTEPPVLQLERSTLAIVLSSLLLIVICIITIVGNIAVMYAIMTTYDMRERVSNIFLINLSITDLSSAMFVSFSAFLVIAQDLRQVNRYWCAAMCSANYCFIIVSMMTLGFISVDRLLSVMCPLKYNEMVTKKRVLAVSLFSWVQGLVFGIAPSWLGWVHYDYWEGICAINWHMQSRSGPINYVISAFAVCFALPSLIMLICYTVTIRQAKKCLKEVEPNSQPASCHDVDVTIKADRLGMKIITSLLVVVFLFFLFLTPFSVTKLIKVLTNDADSVPPYVNLWASFFGYLSSMVNPFVYGIFRADFRKAYRNMFRKYIARSRGNNPDSASGDYSRHRGHFSLREFHSSESSKSPRCDSPVALVDYAPRNSKTNDQSFHKHGNNMCTIATTITPVS